MIVQHGDVRSVSLAGRPFNVMHLDLCSHRTEKSVALIVDTATNGAEPAGCVLGCAFSYGRESPSRMTEIERHQDALDRHVEAGTVMQLTGKPSLKASWEGPRMEVVTTPKDHVRVGRTLAFRQVAQDAFRKVGWSYRLHNAIFYVARHEGRQTPMVYFLGDLKKGAAAWDDALMVHHVPTDAARLYDCVVELAAQTGSKRTADIFNLSAGHVAAKLAASTRNGGRLRASPAIAAAVSAAALSATDQFDIELTEYLQVALCSHVNYLRFDRALKDCWPRKAHRHRGGFSRR
jgi:hypothetical protein